MNHKAKNFLSLVRDCTFARYVNTIQELPDIFITDTTDTLDGCGWGNIVRHIGIRLIMRRIT